MSTPLEYRTLYRNAEGFIRLRANSPAQAWPQLGLDVTLMEQGEAGEAGRLLFACRTDPSMSNPLGMVHGGISAALVDTCMGVTCGIQCGLITPTISMTVNYARPVPLNAELVVRTRTVRCGATSGQMSAEVYLAGEPDKLLVTASGAYCTKPNDLSGGSVPWEEEPTT